MLIVFPKITVMPVETFFRSISHFASNKYSSLFMFRFLSYITFIIFFKDEHLHPAVDDEESPINPSQVSVDSGNMLKLFV
mgnify:CR=1 FL=1